MVACKMLEDKKAVTEGEESSLEHQKNATIWDLYILGITIVIGGQMFSWNDGLQAGFWACFLSLLLMALGYSCLVLCLSELTSALPFSGKIYILFGYKA